MSLYHKYRPDSFEYVFGQSEVVAALTRYVEEENIPQVLSFEGPSGTGKTTLARIVCDHLGVIKENLYEVNAANARGIDSIRDISRTIRQAPLKGTSRAWIIDEAQGLTGDAQDAFLKVLEEPPAGVYFMLATTDPAKLKRTILTRCQRMKLKPLNASEMGELLCSVMEWEEREVAGEVVDQIIKLSDGSPRQALQDLEMAFQIDDVDAQLEFFRSGGSSSEVIDIARAVCAQRASWQKIAPLLKAYEGNYETVRMVTLTYASKILLDASGQKAHQMSHIIECLRQPIFDQSNAGRALLASSLFSSTDFS